MGTPATAHYGSSPFAGLFKPGQPGDREGALRAAYKELAAEVKLMPPTAWFEIRDSA